MAEWRDELALKVRKLKMEKNLKWADLADATHLSKEFLTAAILGKMPLPAAAAEILGQLLPLNNNEIAALQKVPTRFVPTGPPVTQPNLHRLNEIVAIYGDTINELINEEFGDGIISAVDFQLKVTREENPNGDRVNINMSGKFLPYKPY